jgi:CDP-6-deoxy-D-xylo-4-hexulose-3-dehydrase
MAEDTSKTPAPRWAWKVHEMTDWRFPTAFPSWRYGDGGSESAAIDRVLRSDRLTMGPEVEAFEEELGAYHGRRHAVMVNSGSSANLVAVAALVHAYEAHNIEWAGESVVIPAVAWATTYAPFQQFGFGEFIVLDVEDTWNVGRPWYSLDSPRIVVACPVLGNPMNLGSAKLRCELNDAILLEDACEALGARDPDGRLAGTSGDLSTLSFYHSHQISAIEGGAVMTDDDELARLCRLLRNHGNAGWGDPDIEKRYQFTAFGYNLRPVETHAAIAREQLKRLDEMIEQRRRNLAHFVSATDGMSIVHQRTVGSPSPFGLAFRCATREDRRRLVAALAAAGVDARTPTGGSFLRHSYAAPWAGQHTPVADMIHDTGLFLGNAPYPVPELIDLAVRVMKETL